MRPPQVVATLLAVVSSPICLVAGLTVYGSPAAQTTLGAAASTTTTSALPSESSTVTLVPPTPPTNLSLTLPIAIDAVVPATAAPLVDGNFMGWSIELSVATQFLGLDPGHLQVPFLNYLASLSSRARSPLLIRVGGNTQDSSYINVTQTTSVVKTNPSGSPNSYDGTPDIAFGPSLLYTMKNISSLVDVQWVFGLQLLDLSLVESNTVLVAEYAENILSDSLHSLQIGNEPDLYGTHGKRAENYSISGYVTDFGTELEVLNSSTLLANKTLFSGPGVCCTWTPEEVFDAGFLEAFSTSLNTISVQHYPNDNCAATGLTNSSAPVVPQDIFPEYLSHYWVTAVTAAYNATGAVAAGLGLDLIMMETNTASCGGFPGVSDSFGAAIWAVDYGLSLASLGFSNSLFHISGRSTYYNAFQPPPTNESTTRGWLTGPVFYSSLLLTEAFGSGGRVVDLGIIEAEYTRPGYIVFDASGAPSRAVLFNYVTDATGTSDYTALLSIPGSPASVTVKYLSSPSVAEHYNITFAGQSWGGDNSQGLPTGEETSVTITCTTTCNIPVQAPSIALVFLSEAAATDAAIPPEATSSFATTAATKLFGTATVASAVLETSNGGGGFQQVFGYSGTGNTAKSAAPRNYRRVEYAGLGIMAAASLLLTRW